MLAQLPDVAGQKESQARGPVRRLSQLDGRDSFDFPPRIQEFRDNLLIAGTRAIIFLALWLWSQDLHHPSRFCWE
jgi:hypothetical protein